MIPNYLISAGNPPVVTAETVAVHVLGKVPLGAPFVKAMIAKELGFWPDDTGYYSDKRTKYLALSGNALRFNTPEMGPLNFDVDVVNDELTTKSVKNRQRVVQIRLVATVAMAHVLGRTLVLPRIGVVFDLAPA
jgi:hypothetical protein